MMSSRLAGSALLHQLGPRLFSTSAVARATVIGGPANALLAGSSGLAPLVPPVVWLRLLPVRLASTASAPAIGGDGNTAAKEAVAIPPSEPKQIGSSCGIPASKLAKEDGNFKIWGYDRISSYKPRHASMQTFPRWLCAKAQGATGKHLADELNHSAEKANTVMMPDRLDGVEGKFPPVISFSPLEAARVSSGLRNESLKIKRMEISQKLTYALIPALLIISKTKLTTSLLVLSVYWQIYGFFKEIFLDYVHQELTRKWVLVYFKLLLLILAKDTILDSDLV